MNQQAAITVADLHQAEHRAGVTCWQCEPRKTTTFWNHFLALVEDPGQRCPWCDGTGWHLYATPYAEHLITSFVHARRAMRQVPSMPDRLLTLREVDRLHALLDAAARRAVVPCSECRTPVALTPVQMGEGEILAPSRALCSRCADG